MNIGIQSQIKSEYERKQKIASDNLISRTNEVYSKIPRIMEIDDEIHISGIRYNKAILLGDAESGEAVRSLVSKIDGLKKEKEALLLKNGFPANYLQAVYQCPLCKDTGFIDGPNGTEKCACYRQALINCLFNQSNLKLAEKENFSTFNALYYPKTVDKDRYGIDISPRENILDIKDRCMKFVENFSSPDEKNLFFSGPTGVGKTFMSNCIAMELMKKGITVLYQTAPVLFDIISEYKANMFRDEEYEDSSYKNIFDVELLIIDDLGTETRTAARYAEFLNILTIRQMNNLTRPCKIIISTNISMKNLYEDYTERVGSRIISNFDILMFRGEDIRSLKKFKES